MANPDPSESPTVPTKLDTARKLVADVSASRLPLSDALFLLETLELETPAFEEWKCILTMQANLRQPPADATAQNDLQADDTRRTLPPVDNTRRTLTPVDNTIRLIPPTTGGLGDVGELEALRAQVARLSRLESEAAYSQSTSTNRDTPPLDFSRLAGISAEGTRHPRHPVRAALAELAQRIKKDRTAWWARVSTLTKNENFPVVAHYLVHTDQFIPVTCWGAPDMESSMVMDFERQISKGLKLPANKITDFSQYSRFIAAVQHTQIELVRAFLPQHVSVVVGMWANFHEQMDRAWQTCLLHDPNDPERVLRRFLLYDRSYRQKYHQLPHVLLDDEAAIAGRLPPILSTSKILDNVADTCGIKRASEGDHEKRAEGGPTVCYNWNNGTPCNFPDNCRFAHVCQYCKGAHRRSGCPTRRSDVSAGGRED